MFNKKYNAAVEQMNLVAEEFNVAGSSLQGRKSLGLPGFECEKARHVTGFFLDSNACEVKVVDFSTQVELVLGDNTLEHLDAFLQPLNMFASVSSSSGSCFLFLVLHFQVLLNGLRREDDCHDANDIKQR